MIKEYRKATSFAAGGCVDFLRVFVVGGRQCAVIKIASIPRAASLASSLPHSFSTAVTRSTSEWE